MSTSSQIKLGLFPNIYQCLHPFRCMRLVVLMMVFVTQAAFAQTFVEVSPLDFGRIAVVSNTSEATLTVDRFDNISNSANIKIIIPGKAAVMSVTDAAPNTGLFFTATVRGTEMSPSGGAVQTFTFDSLSYDDYQVTNANGELIFKLGGTIKTSGDGGLIFSESPYSALIDVTLSY